MCVFVVAAPLAFRQASSYDGLTMERVAVGLAEHLDPLVRQEPDQFKLNTPYSSYGLGSSVIMAPLHLVGRAVGADSQRSMNLADALMVGATAAVVFATLRRRGVSPRFATVTTLVVIVGSPLLAYAVTDFSEPGVALMVALVVLGLDGVSRQARFAALGVGAAIGGAVLFRTDSILLLAAPVGIALWVLSRRRSRDLTLYALGATPFLAIWVWYNVARFDHPFAGGYRNQGFTHSFLSGAYGLAFSPGRGVFVYAPVLIVAFVVVPSLRGTDRTLAILAIALLVARVVFYARWWSWYGGSIWGPRFLAPVIPAFAPAIAVALQRWRTSVWLAAVVVTGLAMSVLGVWLTTHPERNPYFVTVPPNRDTGKEMMAEFTDPAYVRHIDHTMFDWSVFPLR